MSTRWNCPRRTVRPSGLSWGSSRLSRARCVSRTFVNSYTTSVDATLGHVVQSTPPRAAVRGRLRSLLQKRFGGRPHKYDLSMSEKKTRITITVDPHLSAYAEQLVEAGEAPSVSAVFNDALTERIRRDRRVRAAWKARAAQANPDRVARMMEHIEGQLAQ